MQAAMWTYDSPGNGGGQVAGKCWRRNTKYYRAAIGAAVFARRNRHIDKGPAMPALLVIAANPNSNRDLGLRFRRLTG
jgi:hypothetical protein